MDSAQLEGVLKKWLTKDDPEKSVYYANDVYADFKNEPDSMLGFKPVQMNANVVTVTLVEDNTGGIDVFPGGEGEVSIVLKVDTDGHVQYFKLSGKYGSYVGTTWEKDWKEVSPQTKTVTYYE